MNKKIILMLMLTLLTSSVFARSCLDNLLDLLSLDPHYAQQIFLSSNATKGPSRNLSFYREIFLQLTKTSHSEISLFDETLEELLPTDHILIGGCGNCHSVIDIVKGEGMPKVTGISYGVSDRRALNQAPQSLMQSRSKIIELDGQPFKDLTVNQLVGTFGHPKMIIDSLGHLSLEADLSGTMKKYLDLMPVDGVLFSYISFIHNPDFIGWVERIQGAQVKIGHNMVYIKKTADEVIVPKLIPQSYKPLPLPERLYSLEN